MHEGMGMRLSFNALFNLHIDRKFDRNIQASGFLLKLCAMNFERS